MLVVRGFFFTNFVTASLLVKNVVSYVASPHEYVGTFMGHKMCLVCLLQCMIVVKGVMAAVATGCCARLASIFTCALMATLNMTRTPGRLFLSSASIPLCRKL